MIISVTPLIAASLGASIAVLVTLLAVRLVLDRQQRIEAARVAALDPVADLRPLVAELACGAVIVGPHDEIVEYNAPALTEGVVRGNRIGLVPVLDAVRAARRDDEVCTVELEQPQGGGAARVFAARAIPMEAGRVFLVVDDKTPTLRAEEAARDFLANATHELKTPIGAVTLLSEAIAEAPDDAPSVHHFAERIQAESARLAQLVAQIIQLSRLLGQAELARETVAIDDLLAEVSVRNRELAANKQVNLARAGASGLAVVGDRSQLMTALNNLVQNAIAYSDERARVVMSARSVADSGEVSIAVSDNGIGIPAAEVERIFERFYRVDYARSRENGGTGLGLSIVHEVVHAHGGTVSVWSQPGSGSTFTITLPAVPAAQEVSE